MNRREALFFTLVSISLIAAGLTWRFGFYGLVATGGLMLVGTMLSAREDADDGEE